MARILITGSSGGLGLMAGRLLIAGGHRVMLHARTAERAERTGAAAPGAEGVLVADLSTIAESVALAERANGTGRFDAVVHNAGIGYRERRRVLTPDGVEHVFAVNVLAPYLLTARLTRPDRLVYLSSGMHRGGDPDLDDLAWQGRRWNGAQAYSDSKLFDVLLTFAMARRWPAVLSNAVEPGWVPTRMGGPGAPDDLDQGHRTQAWLAAGDHPAARVTGGYLYHGRPAATHPSAADPRTQDALLAACAALTGVRLPPA